MKITKKIVNKILTIALGILIIFVLLYIINIFLKKNIERFDVDISDFFYNSTTKICNLTNPIDKTIGRKIINKSNCKPTYKNNLNNPYYDEDTKYCFSLYDITNKRFGLKTNSVQDCPNTFTINGQYDYRNNICNSVYNPIKEPKKYGYPMNNPDDCPTTLQPTDKVNKCPFIPGVPLQYYAPNKYSECKKLCPDKNTVVQDLNNCPAQCISIDKVINFDEDKYTAKYVDNKNNSVVTRGNMKNVCQYKCSLDNSIVSGTPLNCPYICPNKSYSAKDSDSNKIVTYLTKNKCPQPCSNNNNSGGFFDPEITDDINNCPYICPNKSSSKDITKTVTVGTKDSKCPITCKPGGTYFYDPDILNDDKICLNICFKYETLILLENNIYKKIGELIKGDRLLLANEKIGIVKIIIKTEIKQKINMCLIDGFYVTPYHPIYKYNGKNEYKDWKYPIDINPSQMEYCDYIYDLHILMEDNTLPTDGFVIKGNNKNWIGISQGHLVNHSIFNNPFWKTNIIEIYKHPNFKIDENGILLYKKNELKILKNLSMTTYGFIYKNKKYTYENNRVIVSDNI